MHCCRCIAPRATHLSPGLALEQRLGWGGAQAGSAAACGGLPRAEGGPNPQHLLCWLLKRVLLPACCRLMSDWKVELVEDNISEFYVEFGGPKDSELVRSA